VNARSAVRAVVTVTVTATVGEIEIVGAIEIGLVEGSVRGAKAEESAESALSVRSDPNDPGGIGMSRGLEEDEATESASREAHARRSRRVPRRPSLDRRGRRRVSSARWESSSGARSSG